MDLNFLSVKKKSLSEDDPTTTKVRIKLVRLCCSSFSSLTSTHTQVVYFFFLRLVALQTANLYPLLRSSMLDLIWFNFALLTPDFVPAG